MTHLHQRRDDPEPTLKDEARQAGLTEDQLAFFTEQTRRAVIKAIRKVRRDSIAGFVVLCLGLAFALYSSSHDSSKSRKATVLSGRAVAVDGCNRDFMTTDRFRALLIRGLVSVRVAGKAGLQTPTQTARAERFYQISLKAQKYPDCSKARSVITDNPEKKLDVPRPFDLRDAKNADVEGAAARISKGGG